MGWSFTSQVFWSDVVHLRCLEVRLKVIRESLEFLYSGFRSLFCYIMFSCQHVVLKEYVKKHFWIQVINSMWSFERYKKHYLRHSMVVMRNLRFDHKALYALRDLMFTTPTNSWYSVRTWKNSRMDLNLGLDKHTQSLFKIVQSFHHLLLNPRLVKNIPRLCNS